MSQPFPIAAMMGAETKAPVQEKMLRMRLLMATPELDLFRGRNSVSIVVVREKISIVPMPKKMGAMSCEGFGGSLVKRLTEKGDREGREGGKTGC